MAAPISALGASEARRSTEGVGPSDPAARALPYNQVSRGSKSGESTPAQQFEGFVLQSFVESMLPKDDGGFYGDGTAGPIWKSMLAERIGAEMARSGGIGIAKMLEAHRTEAAATLDGAKAALTDAAAKAQGAALAEPGAL